MSSLCSHRSEKSNKVNSNNKTQLPVETIGSQEIGRNCSGSPQTIESLKEKCQSKIKTEKRGSCKSQNKKTGG